jgi:hypothetical protein
LQWSLLHFQTLGVPIANVGNKLDSNVVAPLKGRPTYGRPEGLRYRCRRALRSTPAPGTSELRNPEPYRCRYSELFRSSRSTSACVMRLLITLFT